MQFSRQFSKARKLERGGEGWTAAQNYEGHQAQYGRRRGTAITNYFYYADYEKAG